MRTSLVYRRMGYALSAYDNIDADIKITDRVPFDLLPVVNHGVDLLDRKWANLG